MKHLENFNTLKIISNVEDMLLEFEDSGEIEDVYVSCGFNSVEISFNYNEDTFGMDKVIIMDKIISRLKKKYLYIQIVLFNIVIDIERKRSNYITHSLVDKMNKLKETFFSGLEPISDKLNTTVSYCAKGKGIIFKYDKVNKDVYIKKNNMLNYASDNFYFLDDYDIEIITKNTLHKLYNLDIEDVLVGNQL